MRLFRNGKTWYADLTVGGGRVKKSTRCTDRKAAEVVARQWERDLADPDHAAASQASLADAMKLLIEDRKEQAKVGRKSSGTVDFYEAKAGHWPRILETDGVGKRTPFPALEAARARCRQVHRHSPQRGRAGEHHPQGADHLTCRTQARKACRHLEG